MSTSRESPSVHLQTAPGTPTRILFVDDEEMVLRMLQIAVKSMMGQWEASFVGSGRAALDLLAKERFDMVISDMRMPAMTGAQLLNEVFKFYPATFRVILTGFVEQEKLMQTVGTAHQFLTKPFELNRLKELLCRADSLKQRLQGEAVRRIISQTGCVPCVPDVYFKILDALQAPDCPAERIAEIAATDPGLTSKILQLVNSAFFGFASEVSNPKEAVMLLGTGTIRSLALTCRLFSSFKVPPLSDFSVEKVWQHSLRVARTAEHIARLEHADNAVIEQAFTAGLLHDLGKLVLASALSTDYRDVVRRAELEKRPLVELEGERLGATHAQVGAALLQLWGLPTQLVEAVLWHEQPGGAALEAFGPVIAVHVANYLDHEVHGQAGAGPALGFDSACLERLNLGERFQVWREHCES